MATKKREFIDPNELMRYINKNHCYSGLPMAAHICTMELLTYAPRVDAVEVKHGRWIHPKGHVVSNEFLCSECGHGETSYHAIHPLPGGGLKADENGNFFHPPKMNYCPNCGADMRERKDND